MSVYKNLIFSAPFLRNQNKEVVSCMVEALNDVVFLPADFIFRLGDVGRDLFFMRRGEVGVFIDADAPVWGESTEVSCFKEGSYFGEMGMLLGNRRSAWVMAKTYSVCSVLPYSAVETLCRKFPGAFTSLVQSMVKAFGLQGSMTWTDVIARLLARSRSVSIEEAFMWMCSHGAGGLIVNAGLERCGDMELSAESFQASMCRLKVSQFERMVLWAQLDSDNRGGVSFAEFLTEINFEDEDVIQMCGSVMFSTTSIGSQQAQPSFPKVQTCDSIPELLEQHDQQVFNSIPKLLSPPQTDNTSELQNKQSALPSKLLFQIREEIAAVRSGLTDFRDTFDTDLAANRKQINELSEEIRALTRNVRDAGIGGDSDDLADRPL